MTYKYYNPNPTGEDKTDCVVRALTIALNKSWDEVYWLLCNLGQAFGIWGDRMEVWSSCLRQCGFKRFTIPNTCPDCYTFWEFVKDHPRGTYVLASEGHVAAVKDGVLYDSFDSRARVPFLYFEKE